jgi:SAM-dependent methyltransferase
MSSGSPHHQRDAVCLHVQLGCDHNCYTPLYLCAVKRLRMLLVGDAVRLHTPRATVGDAHCHETGNPAVHNKRLRDPQPISPCVRDWVPVADVADGKCALDLPCGQGRHAIYLASLGYCVVAVDNQLGRIKDLQLCCPQPLAGKITSLVANGHSELPFTPQTFDIVVVTHFISPTLVVQLPQFMKPGGLFIYESFGGRGENWRALPSSGETKIALEDVFDLLRYKERRVGPPSTDAVAFTALCQARR